MIDFKIQPRNSGKTFELSNMYHKQNGLFCDINNTSLNSNIKKYNISIKDSVCYDNINNRELRTSHHNTIYFDEFFNQNKINYNDIIQLDKAGKNIVIRGTPYATHEPSEEFLEYLKEYYPETLI